MNNFWNCTLLYYKNYQDRFILSSKANLFRGLKKKQKDTLAGATERDRKLIRTGETVSLNKMVLLKVTLH